MRVGLGQLFERQSCNVIVLNIPCVVLGIGAISESGSSSKCSRSKFARFVA